MPKTLSLSGLAIGGLIVLVFGADLAIGVPFSRAAPIINIGFLIAGLALCYLSYDAFKDAD